MPLQAGTESALLRRIAVEQADSRTPSLVAGLVRDGRMEWFGARGRVDGAAPTADTQYRIGSITKTFVAVQVMRLRDEGRLALNDPLEDHLPGTPAGTATIAQLLGHTAGLTAEPPGEWWERTPGTDWPGLAAALGPETVRDRAGRRYHYSNLAYGVLGEVVARMRGAAWADVLHAEVLLPLGMRRTTCRPVAPHADGFAVHPWADVLLAEPEHDAVAMGPAGQLWASTGDLARWAAFLGGDTAGVLNPDTLAEMGEPAALDDTGAWDEAYGLGLQVSRDGGRCLTGHGGSMPGFRSIVLVDPGERTAAVLMANSTAGGALGSVARDLLVTVAEREPRLPDEWAPMPEADPELLELTGTWYWGPRPFTLRLLADRWLSLAPPGHDTGMRFRPEPDGTWTGVDDDGRGETLRIVRNPDGSVRHLNAHTFVFTRTPYEPAAGVSGGVDPRGWRAGA